MLGLTRQSWIVPGDDGPYLGAGRLWVWTQEAVLPPWRCRQAAATSPGRTARSSVPRHCAHCGGTSLSDSGTKPAREALGNDDLDYCAAEPAVDFAAHCDLRTADKNAACIFSASVIRTPTANSRNTTRKVKPDSFRSL